MFYLKNFTIHQNQLNDFKNDQHHFLFHHYIYLININHLPTILDKVVVIFVVLTYNDNLV